MPPITQPVLFGTPGADRILAALQVFPPDNPWNQDISGKPVQANSARIIASIGRDKHLGYNLDVNFVIVPPQSEAGPGQDPGIPSRLGSRALFDPRQRPH